MHDPTRLRPTRVHRSDAAPGWRNRGWDRPAAPAGGPRRELVAVRLPLEGVDRRVTTDDLRRALAPLQDPDTALVIDGTDVLLRFRAGTQPMGPIGAELAPAGGYARRRSAARRWTRGATPLTIAGSAAAPRPRRAAALLDAARARPELALVLAGGAALAAGFGVHLADGPAWLRLGLLAVSVVLTSTRHSAGTRWRSSRRVRVNIDVLMFAAAAGAASLGHYEEGAFLLFLFGLGAAGERLALAHARGAIDALTSTAPDRATGRPRRRAHGGASPRGRPRRVGRPRAPLRAGGARRRDPRGGDLDRRVDDHRRVRARRQVARGRDLRGHDEHARRGPRTHDARRGRQHGGAGRRAHPRGASRASRPRSASRRASSGGTSRSSSR